MPNYRYIFTIEGSNANSPPFDMFRYDQAWPVDQVAVSLLERLPVRNGRGYPFQMIKIPLASDIEPTPARWASFGWKVTIIRKDKR